MNSRESTWDSGTLLTGEVSTGWTRVPELKFDRSHIFMPDKELGTVDCWSTVLAIGEDTLILTRPVPMFRDTVEYMFATPLGWRAWISVKVLMSKVLWLQVNDICTSYLIPGTLVIVDTADVDKLVGPYLSGELNEVIAKDFAKANAGRHTLPGKQVHRSFQDYQRHKLL